MLSNRQRRDDRQRSVFGAGLFGGFVGAALLLGVVTLVTSPGAPGIAGPNTAHASPTTQVEDRPRGLISAADQRKQIIERMDRILVVLERIESHARDSGAGRPPTTRTP